MIMTNALLDAKDAGAAIPTLHQTAPTRTYFLNKPPGKRHLDLLLVKSLSVHTRRLLALPADSNFSSQHEN